MALKTGAEKTAEDMAGIVSQANRNNKAIEKPGGLTRRNVLIPDNHWVTLTTMSKEEGVNISILVRRAIKEFIGRS